MADNVAITAGTGTTIGTKDLAGVHLQKYIWVNEAGAFIAKAEDTAHSSGDYLVPMGAVRNDAGTPLAGTTLDYIPFTTNSVGGLYVDGSGVTQPVSVLSGDVDVSSHINENLLLHASAARTATPVAPENTNLWHRGVLIVVNVTALTATPDVTPALQIKDELGMANWFTLDTYTAITNVTGTGTYTYYVHPLAATGPTFTDTTQVSLGKVWRLSLTHGDTDSITYSVGGIYLK